MGKQGESGGRPEGASPDPEQRVIGYLRDLIVSAELRPGEKLPSERTLCERLEVNRGYVRKALAKLNHVGLIEILPQRGTIVAGFSGKAISGLLSNIGDLDGSFEPFDLHEVRTDLECLSARHAAERATAKDLESIQRWHEALAEKAEAGVRALEEDHLFHLAIAKASGNVVCFSIIAYITPQILALAVNAEVSTPERLRRTCEEHGQVVRAIVAKDAAGAETAMLRHMEEAWSRRAPMASKPGPSGIRAAK